MFFLLTTASLFSFGAVASILTLTQLWQRKEYRWDRMWSYIKSPEAKDIPLFLFLTLMSGIVGWIFYLVGNTFRANLYGFLSILFVAIYHSMRIYRKGLFRPVWTVKALAIVVTLVSLTGLLAYAIYDTPLATLVAGTILISLPFLSALIVLGINIPFALKKKSIVAKAHQKRDTFTSMTAIGITGSYGKTSVKHFLSQLLSDRSHVVATPHHVNTEIGVAQHMVGSLPEDTEVYIVEMGAYKRGEIAALAHMVKPSIGVMTAIGNQHIDIFGSRENIARAKWELIEALPASGTAVLNADDPMIVEQAKAFTGSIVWYSAKKEATVWATDTSVFTTYIETSLTLAGMTNRIRIQLLSQGLLSCVLAACAAALAVQEKPETIFKKLESLKPYPRTMEFIRGKHEVSIIDDSYSANVTGVLNAFEHLKLFPNKDKRIIMVPMIELGKESAMAHETVGKAAAETGAHLYVFGDSYKQDILRGIERVSKDITVEFIDDIDHLTHCALNHSSADTIILLEGRIPDVVRTHLVS